MAYFIDAEGNYPRHIGDVQLENVEYVYGDDLPEGWQEVAEGVVPECAVDETYLEVEPAVVDGLLTRQFVIVPVEPVVVEDIETDNPHRLAPAAPDTAE